jgi:hypothetical protein
VNKNEDNILNYIPEINCRWDKNKDGKIHLLVPRFKNPWMKRIALRLGRSEWVKIFLDEIGSCSWSLIDGRRNVEEIGVELKQKMGDSVEPVYQRLTEFIVILAKNKFVLLKKVEPHD